MVCTRLAQSKTVHLTLPTKKCLTHQLYHIVFLLREKMHFSLCKVVQSKGWNLEKDREEKMSSNCWGLSALVYKQVLFPRLNPQLKGVCSSTSNNLGQGRRNFFVLWHKCKGDCHGKITYFCKLSSIKIREMLTCVDQDCLNPFHPNISMNILHPVPYTFLRVLMRKICFKIQSFSSWWMFDSEVIV